MLYPVESLNDRWSLSAVRTNAAPSSCQSRDADHKEELRGPSDPLIWDEVKPTQRCRWSHMSEKIAHQTSLSGQHCSKQKFSLDNIFCEAQVLLDCTDKPLIPAPRNFSSFSTSVMSERETPEGEPLGIQSAFLKSSSWSCQLAQDNGFFWQHIALFFWDFL